MQDAHAALDLFERVVGALQQRAQALLQRLDVTAQEAGLQFREQVLHGEERRGFGCVEPQPREFDARGLAALAGEAVAVGVAVVDDRRLHAAAQVFEVALECGRRDLEFVEHFLERRELARRDHLLDFENAFGFVHVAPLGRGSTSAVRAL